MGGGGGCPYSLAAFDRGGRRSEVGGPKSAVTPVRSMRPTTLNSKISSISSTPRSLWSYGYTLWKVAYRNMRYMCIDPVVNIIWGPGHVIRSSIPLDFSSLHHTCRRVFTVFNVTAMWHDRFGRALNGDTFWSPNRTFNAQKNGQRELARR